MILSECKFFLLVAGLERHVWRLLQILHSVHVAHDYADVENVATVSLLINKKMPSRWY